MDATLIVRAMCNGTVVSNAQIWVDNENRGTGMVSLQVRSGSEHTVYGKDTIVNGQTYYSPTHVNRVTLASGETKTIDLEYTTSPQGPPWWQSLLDFLMQWWWLILLVIIIVAIVVVIRYVV